MISQKIFFFTNDGFPNTDNTGKNGYNENVLKILDDASTREELVEKLEELRGLSFLVCTEVPL